jgi:hypothetical protein
MSDEHKFIGEVLRRLAREVMRPSNPANQTRMQREQAMLQTAPTLTPVVPCDEPENEHDGASC